jgi:hypothetical protein
MTPQIHKCLVYDACARSAADKAFIADWDLKVLGPFLNSSSWDSAAYHELLCAEGYTGELCGQCDEGYGHQDLMCKGCMAPAAGRFAYAMTWLYTLLLLLALLLLHRQNFVCFRGVAEYLQNRLLAMSGKSGLLVDNYLLTRAMGDDLAALRAGCEAANLGGWPMWQHCYSAEPACAACACCCVMVGGLCCCRSCRCLCSSVHTMPASVAHTARPPCAPLTALTACLTALTACHCAADAADARRSSSLLNAIVMSSGPRTSRAAAPADPLSGYGVRPHKVDMATLQDAAGKIYPRQLPDSPQGSKRQAGGSSYFTASGSGVIRWALRV